MRITVLQQNMKGLMHHNEDDAGNLTRQFCQIKGLLRNGYLHDGQLAIENLVVD